MTTCSTNNLRIGSTEFSPMKVGHQVRSLMHRDVHSRIKVMINRHPRAQSLSPPSPPSHRRQSAAASRPNKSPPTDGLRRAQRMVSFLKNFKASRCFIQICKNLGCRCSRSRTARRFLLVDQRPLLPPQLPLVNLLSRTGWRMNRTKHQRRTLWSRLAHPRRRSGVASTVSVKSLR